MFQRIYEQDLGGIEMWAQHFYCQGYDRKEYRTLNEQYQLHSVVHSCSWDLNLCSMNDGIRRASIQEVIGSMQLAKDIGATEVTVHPGHMTMACWQTESIHHMQESLKLLADASYRMDMPISLELMEKRNKEFVTNMAMMREITGDLFDFFSYTLDIAHCDSAAEALHILQHLQHISKLHISNRKGSQYHTLLTDGDYDFTTLLPELYSANLPMVVEGYDPNGGIDAFYDDVQFLKAQEERVQYRIS